MGKAARRPTLGCRSTRRRRQSPGGYQQRRSRIDSEYLGQFTQVLSNRALNEIKGGYAQVPAVELLTSRPGRRICQADLVLTGTPGCAFVFQGFQVPRECEPSMYAVPGIWYNLRDDFTVSTSWPARLQNLRLAPQLSRADAATAGIANMIIDAAEPAASGESSARSCRNWQDADNSCNFYGLNPA